MGDEISLSSGILTRQPAGPLLQKHPDRSITFWSSRMLPGHRNLVSASRAAEGIPSILRFSFCAYFCVKKRVSSGISSRCSRNGGTFIGKTSSRK